MPIFVQNKQRKLKLPTAELKARAQRVLGELGYPTSELTVVFLTDAAIAEVNAEWRQKNGPTDVLSFSFLEGEALETAPDIAQMLGDIVISVETAQAQATDRDAELGGVGYGLLEELTFLLIHGALHIVGFDHEEPEQAAEMEAREAELFALFSPHAPRAHHHRPPLAPRG
jgi:probable rRNA maturation factor